MLQVPAYTQIEDVTIYRDDLKFYRFYPVASYPNVRLDAQRHPIFLLVKYAFSDEDRAHNPNLPPGGGYLNFDTQFEVAPDALEQVRAKLQDVVTSEWNHYKSGTVQEQAMPGVAGTTVPPKVELGEPNWTSSKVKLDAPQATQLVTTRVTEGTSSLLDGNISVFSMDLSPAGAEFMEKLLVDPAGVGATDLTPLQVTYEITMSARLPAARIHITADSSKIYDYLHQVLEGRGVDYCTTYDFEHTDIDNETLIASGAVTVQIDTGSSAITDQAISELRNYALELVKQVIQSTFFSNAPTQGTPPGGDQLPPADTQTNPGNTKKYLKQVHDVTSSHIDLTLEQSSVVNWPINPQSTLETFFKGMSADQIKQYVREITLNSDFFSNLQVETRVFTSYDDKALSAVEVDLDYEGTDNNGQHVAKTKSFTFTSKDPQTWSVALIGHQRDFQYRTRVVYQDIGTGPYSAWTTVSNQSGTLDISIPNPGRVEVDVIAGNIDFSELVKRVQVTLAYEDLASNVPHEEYTVTLDGSNLEAHYERLIYAFFQDKFLQYRTMFYMQSGEVVDNGVWHQAGSSQIMINQPFDDLLQVTLLPTGAGWADVVQVIIDLRYQDPSHNYSIENSLVLRSLQEFKTWKVYLKDKQKRDFDYRFHASLKDRFFQTDWQNWTDVTLPIEIDAPPSLKVQVLADTLDFTTSPLTEVTMRYNAAGVTRADTLVFRDKTMQTWTVDVPSGAPVAFSYQVTHHPLGHDPVTLPEVQVQDHTVVVLPAYQISKAGHLSILVLGQLIDFAATPIVEVDLTYDDDLNNVHLTGDAVFMAGSPPSFTWGIDVKDVNTRQYSYTIKYFTPDGQPHPLDTVHQANPTIVIPKYQK